MPPAVIVAAEPDKNDQALLRERLVAFNDAVGGPTDHGPVAVLLMGDGGDTVGGLWGKVAYDWLFVELLIVPEQLRGFGFGTALMAAAEQTARERRCVGVWLDTHGFQAPEFYKKLGYEVFGELPHHPRGTSRYFLRKMLG